VSRNSAAELRHSVVIRPRSTTTLLVQLDDFGAALGRWFTESQSAWLQLASSGADLRGANLMIADLGADLNDTKLPQRKPIQLTEPKPRDCRLGSLCRKAGIDNAVNCLTMPPASEVLIA
jgi:uncharacterized protein YjbI with pentapeptide repeats